MSPLALNTLVEEVTALYGAAGTVRSSSLRPGLPLIEGDATQLRQVIHNLGEFAGRTGRRADARIQVRTELVEIEEANTKARAVRLATKTMDRDFRRIYFGVRSSLMSRASQAVPALASRWSRRSSTSMARASKSSIAAARAE